MAGREATDAIIRGRCAISVNDPGHPVPPGWIRVALLNVSVLGTGHTPSRKFPAYWDGDIPWIGIRDAGAHHGGVINDTIQQITKLGLANSAARLLSKNTICLSRTASVGYVVKMGQDMATSQDFVTWTCSSALDPDFLLNALLAEGSDIRNFGEGSTHTTIYFPEVKAFHIDLPPVAEQRRIVAKIDSLSAKSKRARDHLDHVPRLVQKFKEALLDSALNGNLTADWRRSNPAARWSHKNIKALHAARAEYIKQRRGSRLTEVKEPAPTAVPDSWLGAYLSDVGKLQVGYAFKSTWYSEEGVRLLRGANIAPGQVSWDDEVRISSRVAAEYEQYILNSGDIVIAMDRPLISSGLKVAIIDKNSAGSLLVQRVARYVVGNFTSKDFIWSVINSRIFKEHAIGRASGSDLPHISSNDILSTPIPLPPPEEQQVIAGRVARGMAWAERLAADATSARKLIDNLDQAVLSKAFRGELVPQDTDDEPASVLLERIKAERAGSTPARRGRGRPRLATAT